MTYEGDYTISEELMEEVCEEGLDVLPEQTKACSYGDAFSGLIA